MPTKTNCSTLTPKYLHTFLQVCYDFHSSKLKTFNKCHFFLQSSLHFKISKTCLTCKCQVVVKAIACTKQVNHDNYITTCLQNVYTIHLNETVAYDRSLIQLRLIDHVVEIRRNCPP